MLMRHEYRLAAVIDTSDAQSFPEHRNGTQGFGILNPGRRLIPGRARSDCVLVVTSPASTGGSCWQTRISRFPRAINLVGIIFMPPKYDSLRRLTSSRRWDETVTSTRTLDIHSESLVLCHNGAYRARTQPNTCWSKCALIACEVYPVGFQILWRLGLRHTGGGGGS